MAIKRAALGQESKSSPMKRHWHTLRYFFFCTLLAVLGPGDTYPAFARAEITPHLSPHIWIRTWGVSPAHLTPFPDITVPLKGATLRQRIRIGLGGEKLRIFLYNDLDNIPIHVGAVSIGIAQIGSSIRHSSIRKITFGQSDSITIPPGSPALSDPVDLTLESFSEITLSLFFPYDTPAASTHYEKNGDAYLSPRGDFTASEAMPVSKRLSLREFITGIDVLTDKKARVIVALGDSITDNAGDTDHSWPGVLAKRLSQGSTGYTSPDTSVINAGIGGNHLLRDFDGWGFGQNALARFGRDVLSVPGITHIIVLEGINDIGDPGVTINGVTVQSASEADSAEDIIAGYKQLIARAHANNIKIYGATMTPFSGSELIASKEVVVKGNYSPEKDVIRHAVNHWILESHAFDGVVDFDAVIRDPSNPTAILSKYDSGDHLHPNDAGRVAMANAINLLMLK